jgi:hypothetical protein
LRYVAQIRQSVSVSKEWQGEQRGKKDFFHGLYDSTAPVGFPRRQ